MPQNWIRKILFILFPLSLPFTAQAIQSMTISNSQINATYAPSEESILRNDTTQSNSLYAIYPKTTYPSTERNIPLIFNIQNDSQPYSLGVIVSESFQNPDIKTYLRNNTSLGSSNSETLSFTQPSPFEITAFEKTFFSHENPVFSISSPNFLLDIVIPEGAKAGIQTATLKFILYNNNIMIEQKEVTLTLEIKPSLLFKITFQDASRQLDFGTLAKDVSKIEKKIDLKVISNLEKPFRIFQKRSAEIKSDLNNMDLKMEDIYYQAENNVYKGALSDTNSRNIPTEEQLIYTSDSQGSAETLPINYVILNRNNYKAGNYRAVFTFRIDTEIEELISQPLTIPVDFRLTVARILEFQLTPNEGTAYLDFSSHILDSQKKDCLLKIDLISNTGRPYHFFHALKEPFINSSGARIDSILYALCNKNGELTDTQEYSTLNLQPRVLYTSNETGDSQTFYVRYRMDYDSSQNAGFYRTDIEYSLTDD